VVLTVYLKCGQVLKFIQKNVNIHFKFEIIKYVHTNINCASKLKMCIKIKNVNKNLNKKLGYRNSGG